MAVKAANLERVVRRTNRMSCVPITPLPVRQRGTALRIKHNFGWGTECSALPLPSITPLKTGWERGVTGEFGRPSLHFDAEAVTAGLRMDHHFGDQTPQDGDEFGAAS